MHKKRSLIFLLFFCTSLCFITSAFSFSWFKKTPRETKEEKGEVCGEAYTDSCAYSYPLEVKNPCPIDSYFHGEFLWMQPMEGGLEFAMAQDSSPNSLFPLTNGQIKGFSSDSNRWKFNPGFRIGFGFYFGEDTWNLLVDWTYIRMKTKASFEKSSGNLLPLYFPANNTGIAQRHMQDVSAEWIGDYDTVDVMLGKPYHVSRSYISNPTIGMRVAWIDQEYHIRYFMDFLPFLPLRERDVFFENDFWGIGLRAAYEGKFVIFSGWQIIGKVAFSMLFSKFDMEQRGRMGFFHPRTDSYLYDTGDKFYGLRTNAEMSLGCSYKRLFYKKYFAVFNVAYEFHHWWNQNQARRFLSSDPTANDTVSRGDLSFNGFMFGIAFDF